MIWTFVRTAPAPSTRTLICRVGRYSMFVTITIGNQPGLAFCEIDVASEDWTSILNSLNSLGTLTPIANGDPDQLLAQRLLPLAQAYMLAPGLFLTTLLQTGTQVTLPSTIANATLP